MLPRYQIHNYSLDNSLVKDNVNMIGLVLTGYVKTELMQAQIEVLRVGDEQLSDEGNTFIRRIS